MKIVYMGTPDFAVPALRKLAEAGHDIELVVTQPDRRGNRGKVKFSPVKEAAVELGIEVAQPQRLKKDEALMKRLENMAPDMIVVAAFGQILPDRVLSIPEYGCINIHGSLLPQLRGAAPVQYAILEGLEKTGVTIMRMDAGIDTGDMISKYETEIGRKNAEELSEELASAGADLLVDTIRDIQAGNAVYTKQDDSMSSYAHMISKHDGFTDFSGTAEEEERKIRAFYDWPASFSYLDGRMVKFFAAEPLEGENPTGECGTVKEVSNKFFTVNCNDSVLRIDELQLQGKKRLKTADFLRGFRLTPGMKFGDKED
jgi:methionyl-tRNA formyltransferase